MALQVASLFGVLRMDDSDFRSSAKNARSEMTGLGDQMQKIGGSITSLGTNLTGLTAPAAAAFGIATKQAIDFDSSITNIGAVLGLTSGQMDDLNAKLLEIGGSRRAGPQAVAEAFYDIVGGVADASTHMAILNAALDTSEAGAANLKATTSGLISVMNSYGMSADKASHVSDVFTRVVGVGVGTMDEFVAALGPVAGLAASTGVSFEELGTSAAFLTTKGFSATQSATRLQAAITALIKPNDAMTKALKAAGLESGSAALKQLGLAGTLQKVSDALGGSTDAMAAALGTTEALGATTALLGEDFKGFSDNFAAGLDGATAAAQAIQNLSDQAKLDLLNSQMSELAITAGGALVPSLLQVVESVKPIVSDIIDWVNQNPELVAQIGMIVAGLAVAGPILIGVGAAISAIGGIIGLVLSPIGLIIAAVAGLALAFATNFGGIQDTLLPIIQPIIDLFSEENGGLAGVLSDAGQAAQDLVNIGLLLLTDELNKASIAAQQLLEIGLFVLVDTLNKASTSAQLLVQIGLLVLVDTLSRAATAAQQLVLIVQDWVKKNEPLLTNIRDLVIAFFAAQGLIAGFNAIQTAMTAGATARAALTTWITGTLGPVAALTLAIYTLIKAFEAMQKFDDQMQAGQQLVKETLGSKIASGEITPQQYSAASFNAQQNAFGGGFGGDLAARYLGQIPVLNRGINLAYDQNKAANAPGTQFGIDWNEGVIAPLVNSLMGGMPAALQGQLYNIKNLLGIGSGDYEGVHPAGAYVVGTGAQPQLFMPTQDMYGVPNIDQKWGGGDGMQFSGPIYVTANNPQEFGDAIRSKYKGRGN